MAQRYPGQPVRPGTRAFELLEVLKQEVETMSHDSGLLQLQREEYELKLQSQVQELLALQRSVGELERVHLQAKRNYEDEIRRLQDQLEACGGKPDRNRINNQLAKIQPYQALTSQPASNGPVPQRSSNIFSDPRYMPKEDPKQPPFLSSGQPYSHLSFPAPLAGNPPRLPQLPMSAPNTPLSAENDWMVGYNSAVSTKYTVELNHTLAHQSVVCCVCFSKDARFLATGCNRTAQIFDVTTGQKLETFSQDGYEGDLYIRAVCFSNDGKLLATGAEDNKLRIYQIAPKKLLRTLEGHELDIYSLAFSPDGRFIVSGSGDKKAIMWDAETGRSLRILGNEEVGPTDGVTSVAISPDSRLVATGSLDRVVRLWNAQTGKFVERFDGHTDSIYSVSFSPDGKYLVSGSLDRTLKLWDLSESLKLNRCQVTFNGHKDFVLSACFSPDGEWLISGSKDRSVQFWSPKTGVSHIILQGHKNSVISVAHAPAVGSPILATGSGDRTVRIWSYKKVS